MSCFGDIICFLEDLIEFLLCIITQSAISCVVTVGVLMGTMMYLKRQYRPEESLHFGVSLINLAAEGTGPMPTTTGTSRPPVNLQSRDVPYLPYHNVPQGPLDSYNAIDGDTYSHFADDYATIGATDGTTSGVVNSARYDATYRDTNGNIIGGTSDPTNGATNGATRSVTYGSAKGVTGGATYGATNGTTSSAPYDDTNRAISGSKYDATYGATNRTMSGTTKGAVSSASYGATNRTMSDATHGATNRAMSSATNRTMSDATHGATNRAMSGATNRTTSGATYGTTKRAMSGAANSATSGATYSPTDKTMGGVIHSASRGIIYGATNEAISGAIDGIMTGGTSRAIADATGVVTSDDNNAYLTQTDPHMGTCQTGAGTGASLGYLKILPLIKSCESCRAAKLDCGSANLCRSYSYTSCCCRPSYEDAPLDKPIENNCRSLTSKCKDACRNKMECQKWATTRNAPSRKTISSIPGCCPELYVPSRARVFVKKSTAKCNAPCPNCKC